MPRTEEQYKEIRNEKKKLITNVALKLFANEGYTRTSINQIAKEANISKGLLYNYFQSKEELLKHILNALGEEFSEFIDPNKDDVVTEQEAFNYIDITFEMLKNQRESLKYYYQLAFQPEVMEILSNPNVIREDIIKQEYLLLDFLAAKQPNVNPKIVVTNIISFMKGFSMMYVYSPETYTDEFLEEYKIYLKEFIAK